MKATVQSSTRRRDEKWLVVARAYPGNREIHAVSDRPVRDGQTVTIRDGKVVA